MPIVSTCYKKVANHIWPVWMALQENIILSEGFLLTLYSLSLFYLLIHQLSFHLKSHTRAYGEKWTFNTLVSYGQMRKSWFLFLINSQEEGIAWEQSEWEISRRIIQPSCHPHHQAYSMGGTEYSHTPWYIWWGCQNLWRKKIGWGIWKVQLCNTYKSGFVTEKGWEIPLACSWPSTTKCCHHQGLWSTTGGVAVILAGLVCSFWSQSLLDWSHTSLPSRLPLPLTTDKPFNGGDQLCFKSCRAMSLHPTRWDAWHGHGLQDDVNIKGLLPTMNHWRWMVYFDRLHGALWQTATTSGAKSISDQLENVLQHFWTIG